MTKLTITIQTTSPLHVADASSGEAHLSSDGSIRSGRVPGTMPVTRIEKKPVLIPADVSGDTADKVMFFPYLKANNLVGRLRRFAQDIVNDEIAVQGHTISDKTYRGMSCGAVSGTPAGDSPTMEQLRSGRQNIYLGLFGGGNVMVESGMSFGDLNVKHRFLADAGVLPDGITNLINVPAHQLSYPIQLVRRDRMLELTDYNIEKVVEGGSETIEAWRALVASASNTVDKPDEQDGQARPDKKAKRQMLKNLVSYEAALAGLSYVGTVTMRPNTHDGHIGLLLESLARMANHNGLGGKAAKGFGRFNMQVEMDGKVLLASRDGHIVESNYGDYFDALSGALESLDIQELESFFA